ncbi:hypothetical protein V4F39_21115 [Aquincola sp. MAHUQ-54]|uniref:Big-1 domain-containing protein n=1 Tax=Aquincola agrisoli TaxID=3119538 RepID=A0AAW9QN64_9BURK
MTMMRMLKAWLCVAALSFMAACGGGGGDAGTPVLGPGSGASAPAGSVSASDLVLTLSASTIANSGLETVVATATALDGSRNTIAGVPVQISVDSGATATTSGTTTDTDGSVTATIGIGADRSNRTITVTARTGSVVRTATLQVVEAGGSGEASDLVLVLSSANIANNNSETVTATVTALDGKRNAVPGVAVSLSVNSDAIATPSDTKTNASGVLTATVGIGSNQTNRAITVTATSGSLTRTATLMVTDAPSTETPVAADLSLTLSSASLNNGGTGTVLATATAVDRNRNALPGIPVTIGVDSSAVATVSGNVTNAQGVVTANVGIGADRTNRVVTITATSGTLTRSASFRVVGARLSASLAPLVDAGSANNQIEYTLVDTNSIAMVDQPISVTAPGLPTTAGRTDINGKFVYSYTAPATAGTVSVTATAAGDSRVETVQVQLPGSGSVDPAVGPVLSASVTPSPSVISVNAAGSSANLVELRALFLGSGNKPIKNVRVRFDLDGNVSNTDGVVSWLGGAYAYSDTTGVARGTFTPGLRSSPTNGITIRACYDTVDFPTSGCPNATRATLTVVSEALAVSIRTNELIKEGPADLTYIKEFVVMVVDSAGQAKADVQITPSIDLPAYYKGYYQWNGLNRWVQVRTLTTSENYRWNDASRAWELGAATSQPSCPNEDVNRNGVREAGTYVSGQAAPALSAREEDLNWNGDLDARKSDVAVKMVGSSKTDANGLAIVQIEYGKDLATWVDFVITVTASGISGTEARARYSGLLYGQGNLPAPGEAVTNENAAPAFVISPYGRAAVCTNPN